MMIRWNESPTKTARASPSRMKVKPRLKEARIQTSKGEVRMIAKIIPTKISHIFFLLCQSRAVIARQPVSVYNYTTFWVKVKQKSAP
ncbi:MAG: hypothetical protein ACOCU8_01565 [Patescibacteria group bacterium]